MNNILITSAGRRVSLIRFFQKELKKNHLGAKVLTTDMYPELSAACYVSDGSFKISKVTSNLYLEQLLEIVSNNNVSLIIPTIDTELLLLALHKETFEKIGCNIIISDTNFTKICRDKRQTAIFFEKYNIKVPKVYSNKDINYPVFVKPFNGSRSVDTHVIKNVSEMKNHFIDNPDYMIMEYIDSKKYVEYTVDAYYDINSNLKSLVPRERIFVRDGEVNKGITRKNSVYKILISKFNHIEGARGCLTLQFFVNKENITDIVGIEINPRFGGGYPLSYHAGANFPKFIINEYLEKKEIDFFDSWEDRCLMLRYDEEIIIKNYDY